MNALKNTLICACLALAAGAATAADDMKKKPDMAKDGMKEPMMSMQQCKDHMAMAKKDMKKDDAMMKMEAQCADMMKKEPMGKDPMKK